MQRRGPMFDEEIVDGVGVRARQHCLDGPNRTLVGVPAGRIQRQRRFDWKAGEQVPPVVEFDLMTGTGVVSVAEDVAVPHREVGVLDREWFQWFADVEGRQVADERPNRILVGDHVVRMCHQHIAVFVSQQRELHSEVGRQIQRRNQQFADAGVEVAALDLLDSQPALPSLVHDLNQ